MSLLNNVTRLARGPQGRRAIDRARRYASTPQGRRQMEAVRARLGKRPR